MNIVKFIKKQGKTKESDPKIFEESVECVFPLIGVSGQVIPMSSIKSELLKCSFKAEEPNKFLLISSGKAKKVEIDCFDFVKFDVPVGYGVSAVNFQEMEGTTILKKHLIEYSPVEKSEDGKSYTVFFGDFLKMIMHTQYQTIDVAPCFYNRLGVVPVITDEHGDVINIDIVYSSNQGRDPRNPYIDVTTEKGDTFFIHTNL